MIGWPREESTGHPIKPNFYCLCLSGFLAKASYALARTPVLALFPASFGVGPEAIGFALAISTITGVFFKMPAGVISDINGRRRTMLISLVFFAISPFLYLWFTPTTTCWWSVADCRQDNIGSAMGVFGSLYDVGHATGPNLAGLLIGLSEGRDFRLAFTCIAAILVVSALLFRRTIPAS